jgi:hypothetical protein
LPPTATSGFGVASESGRIRVPSPAARTIAVRGTLNSIDFVIWLRRFGLARIRRVSGGIRTEM